MNQEIPIDNQPQRFKSPGIIVIVCSVFSIMMGLLLLSIGLLFRSASPADIIPSQDAYILIITSLIVVLVAIFDLIAGIKIYKNAKSIKGWSIYLIATGVLGGLLGYVMMGVGIYVLMQLNKKAEG